MNPDTKSVLRELSWNLDPRSERDVRASSKRKHRVRPSVSRFLRRRLKGFVSVQKIYLKNVTMSVIETGVFNRGKMTCNLRRERIRMQFSYHQNLLVVYLQSREIFPVIHRLLVVVWWAMSLDLEIKCSMEDCDQCVELIVRAKQRPGAFESVMTRVTREPYRSRSPHRVHGLRLSWRRLRPARWDCEALPADLQWKYEWRCYKRQRDGDEFSMSSGGPSDAAGYTSAAPKTPPFVTADLPRMMMSATLPPGVVSIGDWGDYKVAFGKF